MLRGPLVKRLPACAYMAVVKAATNYIVGSCHLPVVFARVFIAALTRVFTTCTRTKAKHRPTAEHYPALLPRSNLHEIFIAYCVRS